jgi:hypothetical protein
LDINPFIQTAFGAIVGGGVVVATNWLNTTREKRKEVQEWYEQRYVTEGLDRLLAYFTNLALRFLGSPNHETILLPDATVPVEALTRIEVLLDVSGGMEFLSIFIAQIHESLASSGEYQDIAVIPLFRLCETLYQLRQEVLNLIPSEVSRKNQKLNLTQFRDSIVLLVDTFVKEADALNRKNQQIKHILETGSAAT